MRACLSALLMLIPALSALAGLGARLGRAARYYTQRTRSVPYGGSILKHC